MIELVVGIVELAIAALELAAALLEPLLHMLAVCFMIIGYLLFPSYRAKKQREWAANPKRKPIEITVSCTCLVGLVSLSVWFFWPEKPSTSKIEVVTAAPDEDVRLKLTPSTNEPAKHVTLGVKQGGVNSILNTGKLADLQEAIRTNVHVIPKEETGATNDLKNSSAPSDHLSR